MVRNSEIPWGALFGPAGYAAYGLLHDDWSMAGYNNWSASLLSDVPIIGAFPQAIDNSNYAKDYQKNTGIGWADVRYPTRNGAFRTGYYGSMRSGASFVSKNIDKLYR